MTPDERRARREYWERVEREDRRHRRKMRARLKAHGWHCYGRSWFAPKGFWLPGRHPGPLSLEAAYNFSHHQDVPRTGGR